MSAESIVSISAAVVAITQLIKWAGMRDAFGPVVVILLSGIGVTIWLFSQANWPPVRTDTWDIFAGWVAVALSAAGVFGFSRAAASAVTSVTEPPKGGAGGSPTVKEGDAVTDPDALAAAVVAKIRAEMSSEPERVRVVPGGRG